MYWKGKGRSASNQEWMLLQMVQTASVLTSFHVSSNVIWIAFRNLILRTTAINPTLVTHWMWESEDWLWAPLPVTWVSVWTCLLPGHLSGSAFYGFHHDQRPWEHCCKGAHSLSHNQAPGFLWKWVLTENSHMCCPRQSLPRWPGKKMHMPAYVFTLQLRTRPATSSSGWKTSSRLTVSIPAVKCGLHNWQHKSVAWLKYS